MLRSLFDASDQFNAAHWVLLSAWPTWVLVAVSLLAIGLCWLSWRNSHPLTPKRRWILLSLRLGTVFLVLLLFLQPGVRLEDRSVVQNHVAVLVDQSRSMGLPGNDKGTRLDDVRSFLGKHAKTLEAWRQPHQVDFYSFGANVQPAGDLAALKPLGDSTDLVTAIEDVGARYKPGDLAAVILVGDGADTGQLSRVKDKRDIPKVVRSAIKRLDAPLHTVFSGPEEAPPDLAVSDIAYDDFAFVRNAVTIEATVVVQGYKRLSLPVTLTQNGREIGRRVLEVVPDRRDYRFSFEFVPDATGKAVFSFQVKPASGEKVIVNNRRDFVIRVIRDKIRVLQVVGRPSWDERFLRKLLKKNPNVDLISFFILRTSSSLSPARRNEMSLIPFPTRELFEEQLGSFDLIIFQNFTYRGYRMRQYLPLIRNYVREGGGFVMLGGDISFASGGYASTPIADFLPVTLPAGRDGLVLEERFRPVVTQAGRYHPITALNLTPDENRSTWAAMPKLAGINRVAGLHSDASVLLAHPTVKSGQVAAPVAAVRNYGKGRVLAVMTDSTWRWDFQSFGAGKDNRHYYKFWGNAIRWLIRDPDLKPIRVSTDKDRYPLGTTVTAVVKLMGVDYQPARSAEVTLVAQARANGRRAAAKPIKIKGKTNEAGEFIGRFKVEDDGPWDLTATAEGREIDGDQAVFVVATDPIELTSTAPRPEILAALAQIGNGRAQTLDDDLDDLTRKKPRLLQVNRRKDLPLWSNAWLLLLAIFAPSGEWFLRRRWGLL